MNTLVLAQDVNIYYKQVMLTGVINNSGAPNAIVIPGIAVRRIPKINEVWWNHEK